jgi:transposase-like protein
LPAFSFRSWTFEVSWILGPAPLQKTDINDKTRQRYSPEFKAQAVELIYTGRPVTQIAEELCIGSNLLYKQQLQSQGAQSGPQRTTCAPCGAKTLSSAWKMTF